jgi:Histidine kinase-, DNA gyrase B-, and HSP90-like ATPase
VKYNCQTLPAELRSKQNARWHPHGAIAELVDNSFGTLRGNASEVVISYDQRHRILEVLDNGQGMDHIGRLFQGGNSIGRGIGDIGEYGAGGSLAVLWLATKVEIWTMRGDGRVMSDEVIWKDWISASSFKNLGVSDDWVRATPSNTPTDLLAFEHGTLIRLHLMPKRKIDSGKIRHELARLYSPGLRRGKKITWNVTRKNESLESNILTDAFVAPSANADSIDFDIVLDHDDGASLPVKGRVFYDETTSQADSRLQIGYGHRIICSVTECFQSRETDEKYAGVGVSGWLDLGDDWRGYLTTTKDGVDDEILFDTLMEYVFQKIRPLLKKSQQKIFAMQFDDLALGLERALNQRGSGNITVHVQTSVVPIIEDQGGIAEDVAADQPADKDPPSGPSQREAPPRLTIQLSPLNDLQMKGHLCRSDIRDNEITVYINQEHTIIEEAMKAKPVNKMLLNTVVINELAGELALERYEPFVGKLFRPQVARIINEIEDGRDKSRTLTRELIDRVRSLPKDEPPIQPAA